MQVESGVICHQVNCQGVMGAGLAESIREKFPLAYQDYREAFRRGKLELGHVVFSEIRQNPFLCIAHLCGQDHYGRQGCYTDYTALEICFLKVARYVVNITAERSIEWNCFNPPTIFIPYKIGCGLAGGDWSIVLQILHKTLSEVTICRR
jgi:O-acetyl-ADP-ribose deacetylase (regulator of RNase III)